MKKIFGLLMVFVLVLSMAGCAKKEDVEAEVKEVAATTEKDAEEAVDVDPMEALKGKKIGFVNAGPDDYYSKAIDVFSLLAEELEWEISVVSSEYQPQKEIDNVNDFIVAGYDAIAIISATQISATEACSNANDAGVPIFFGIASPNPDECAPDGMAFYDLYSGAKDVAQWVVTNLPDAQNIYRLDGQYGQGMAEAQIQGFDDGLTKAGFPASVSIGTGEWQREPSLKKAQDFIASGVECDVIFTGNEEMAAGIIQAYEENSLTPPPIVATNGKEAGIEMIEQGLLKATSPNPPSLIADLMIQQMIKFFLGETYEKVLMVLGAEVIDGTNTSAAIPWIAENYVDARAKKTFKYELDFYEEQLNK